jgi:hypothetical protein
MTIGQQHDGTTVNATVSMSPLTGAYTYSFNNPFALNVQLGDTSGVVVSIGATLQNNEFQLQNSVGDILNGGNGNDTFVVGKTAVDLGGNVLHGGAGIDIVQLQGSNQTIDLTGVSAGTAASNGIDAVVAHTGLTGETVDVSLAQIRGSSTLTNGGTGPGKAFVALLGADGAVNVTQTGKFKLVGILNAAGAGFNAAGASLSASDTAALAAMVTKIDDVQGTLATDYTGTSATHQKYVPNALSAYVFSDGTNAYTVWTDGVVTPYTPTGNSLGAAYQPAPSVNPAPVLGLFDQYNKTGAASAVLGVNAGGLPTLKIDDGTSLATAAIQLKAGVTGEVIHGDNGANGGDWFGLGGSGGGNTITGSVGDDVFDLQNSTALLDTLNGGTGFDVVRAVANGADVDLTTNTTGFAAHNIEGVVSDTASTKAGGIQTVEVNPNQLKFSVDATGAKTAVFEAMLGSADDTVTLEGAGKWMQVATFAPGAALPTHASALVGGALLDSIYGGKTHTAENSLTGYLYEEVNAKGAPIEYVTIYSDATIANNLAAPSATLLSQAMAQFGASTLGGGGTSDVPPPTNQNPPQITPPN